MPLHRNIGFGYSGDGAETKVSLVYRRAGIMAEMMRGVAERWIMAGRGEIMTEMMRGVAGRGIMAGRGEIMTDGRGEICGV